MLKRIAGGLMILMGISVFFWVLYSRLVLRQPDHDANSLRAPIGFSLALCVVGYMWVTGQAISKKKPTKRKKVAVE
jgi:hypothetical protein